MWSERPGRLVYKCLERKADWATNSQGNLMSLAGPESHDVQLSESRTVDMNRDRTIIVPGIPLALRKPMKYNGNFWFISETRTNNYRCT